MKRLLIAVTILVGMTASLFAVNYPVIMIGDQDKDLLKMNEDGSITVQVASNTAGSGTSSLTDTAGVSISSITATQVAAANTDRTGITFGNYNSFTVYLATYAAPAADSGSLFDILSNNVANDDQTPYTGAWFALGGEANGTLKTLEKSQ